MLFNEYVDKIHTLVKYMNDYQGYFLSQADNATVERYIARCDEACSEGHRIIFACYTGAPQIDVIAAARWLTSLRHAEQYRRDYGYSHIARIDTLHYSVDAFNAEMGYI